MVDWQKLERSTDAAIIRTFGQAVRHSPFRNGAVDQTRPITDLRGILHAPNADGTVQLGNGMITTLASTESALVLSRQAYPGIVVRQGDRIRATNEAGAFQWYEVSKVSDRFTSILVIHLTEA